MMRNTSALVFMLLVSLPALRAGEASAAVPAEFTVQGKLTNTLGAPVAAGAKTFTFKIFNTATAGTEIWPSGLGENQTISTDAAGMWTARVGRIVPLTHAVFADSSRWLQVTVYDGVNPPEILSRIKVNVAPYSYRVGSVDGANGGQVMSTLSAPGLELGTASVTDGVLELYGAGSSTRTVAIENGAFGGGQVTCYDAAGPGLALQLLPDADGTGGFLTVHRGGGASGVVIDGNANGSGDPLVVIEGASRSIVFDTREAGDLAVQLPAGSISAAEIANEPGIACNGSGGAIALNTTAMTDIDLLTITTPDAGYIVVEAKTYVNCYGTTADNYAILQIDTTSGGTEVTPYAVYAGLTAYAGTGYNFFPVYASRVFYRPAGAYTFRIEGMQINIVGGGTIDALDPEFHATYFTTAYGTVSTLVSASEAGQFASAVPVAVSLRPGRDQSAAGLPMYQVDLRELELRAARLQAEIERAKRELLEVELARQEAAARGGSDVRDKR